MKKVGILLLMVILAMMVGARPMTTITLTAADVSSAGDIEVALRQATDNGMHFGAVVLDASGGDFVYSGDDRSINIYLSNAILVSRNGAVIANCADGIFFNGLPADNVTIQGITFRCSTNGVISADYRHSGVRILDNTFEVAEFGIGVGMAQDWKITGNHISAATPIQLGEGSSGVKIADNTLDGTIGIYLQNADENQIQGNKIRAEWQGVLLGFGSSRNKINANQLSGMENAAFSWEGENHGNKIHGNRAACQSGAACVLINALEQFRVSNKFSGNGWLK